MGGDKQWSLGLWLGGQSRIQNLLALLPTLTGPSTRPVPTLHILVASNLICMRWNLGLDQRKLIKYSISNIHSWHVPWEGLDPLRNARQMCALDSIVPI